MGSSCLHLFLPRSDPPVPSSPGFGGAAEVPPSRPFPERRQSCLDGLTYFIISLIGPTPPALCPPDYLPALHLEGGEVGQGLVVEVVELLPATRLLGTNIRTEQILNGPEYISTKI